MAHMGERSGAYRVQWVNLTKRDYLEDGRSWGIILKWILKNMGARVLD